MHTIRLIFAVILALLVTGTPAPASPPPPPGPPALNATSLFNVDGGRERWSAVLPDGSAVVLKRRVSAVDVTMIAKKYRWHAAGVLAVPVALFGVARLIGVIRLSRRHGKAFCRKCRYPADGLTTPKCPECGTPLAPEGTFTKRQYARRLIAPVLGLGAIAVLALAAGSVLGGPGHHAPRWASFASASLYERAERSKSRWLYQFAGEIEDLLTIDLKSGATLSTLSLGFAERPESEQAFLTPDGLVIDATGDRQQLLVWDPRTGSVLASIDYPELAHAANLKEERDAPGFIFPSGWYCIAGMPDADHVLVAGFEASLPRSDLLEANIRNGSTRTVMEHKTSGGGIPYPSDAIFVPARGGSPARVLRFVTNPAIWTDQGMGILEHDLLRVLRYPTGECDREFPVAVQDTVRPAIDPAGAFCFPGYGDGFVHRVSLDSGSALVSKEQAAAMGQKGYWGGMFGSSPDGRRMYVQAPTLPTTPPTQIVHCIAMPESTPVAALITRASGYFGCVSESADGSRVALVRGGWFNPPGKPAVWRTTIEVYDGAAIPKQIVPPVSAPAP